MRQQRDEIQTVKLEMAWAKCVPRPQKALINSLWRTEIYIQNALLLLVPCSDDRVPDKYALLLLPNRAAVFEMRTFRLKMAWAKCVPCPEDALGRILLQGPTEWRLPMSEVSLETIISGPLSLSFKP